MSAQHVGARSKSDEFVAPKFERPGPRCRKVSPHPNRQHLVNLAHDFVLFSFRKLDHRMLRGVAK